MDKEDLIGFDPNKPNPRLWFYITDKWFKILEFFLVIGIFDYLRHKIDNIYISIIYWISLGLVFFLYAEIVEFLGKPFKKLGFITQILIHILVIIPFVLVGLLLSKVAIIIAENNLF